jgi:hypothetical protein
MRVTLAKDYSQFNKKSRAYVLLWGDGMRSSLPMIYSPQMYDLKPPRSRSVTIAAALAILTGCLCLSLSAGLDRSFEGQRRAAAASPICWRLRSGSN